MYHILTKNIIIYEIFHITNVLLMAKLKQK